MNKRLKELYTQVCMEQKLPFTVEHNSAVMLDAFADKFAQLIVAECAKIAIFKNDNMVASDDDGYVAAKAAGRWTAAKMINTHFGVEE